MLNAERLKIILRLFPAWTELLKGGGQVSPMASGSLEALLLELHKLNGRLWDNEDEARRSDLDDATQVAVKKESHRLNQARNDAIELVDEWLLENAYGHLVDSDLPIRTETPGSALDRLSILSLKIYHMNLQADRQDATESHKALFRQKLSVLKGQRADLEGAVLQMIDDLNARRIRMKIYRQFKMYNDPNTNPRLYNAGKSLPANTEGRRHASCSQK